MLRKFASVPIIGAETAERTKVFSKTAARAVFKYEPREGFLYVRSRAISSRCNENYDEFPADEIKKGYKTFIGKPVFVNHHNDDHRRARGFIIDAALHEDTNPDGSPDTWAEVLMEVDAKRFPKLAKAVLAGEIDRTSMGVDVDHSICSACNNKATRPDEYCQHVPGQKGNRLYRHTASGRRVGILIREACYGLHFFENSLLVEDPADPTAFAWVDKPGKTAKLHTALPGTSSEDHDRGRHKGRDAAACEQCGSDIYLVQDGSPGGSWQHDIDSGAGIPHKARPVIGNVPFGRESMLIEAAKSKKRSDMTPAELAADDRANRKARAWLNRNTPRINRVVDHWNQATEDEKAHGKSWYQDAHHMTRHIAESTGVDMHTAAGLMSVYSPQTHWAQNIMTAARVARTGEALGGKGSGVLATSSQKNAAERMLNGESYEKALGGPKTKAFAHLIEHGGNADPNDPKVVIDRHAASVACGARMTDRAYGQSKLGTKGAYAQYTTVYHKAAKQISKQEGQPIEPHQVQATTWLVRQRLNEQEDRALSKTAGSRSSSAAKRAIEQWSEYAGEHHPNLVGKIPGTGYSSSSPEDVQHASRMVDEHEPKEESVNKHQAFLRHMAQQAPERGDSVWHSNDWAKPSGKAPYNPLHAIYGGKKKQDGHGPWHITRHPETRDYQLVDNSNRLVHTISSAGRSDYELHPAEERGEAQSYWAAANAGHGHINKPEDEDHEFRSFISRPRPPFKHSTEDPKVAEYKARPTPRVTKPGGSPYNSLGDRWNGPYEVVQHPETGKYHVVDGDGNHAGVGPRGGSDDVVSAQERRDYADGRMRSKETARGIADNLFGKTMDILDPGGTDESRRSEQNSHKLNDLANRYQGGPQHPLTPGRFGFKDHDREGDQDGSPYYEVKDPGGSGWKARDYGYGHAQIHHEATGEQEHDRVDITEPGTRSSNEPVTRVGFGHEDLHQELHHWIHGDPNDDEDRYGYGSDYARSDPRISRWQKRNRYQASKRVAFGEVKAPMSVDTLRQTKCPVCGSDNSAFASGVCRVCGFVQPPTFLQDPDLDLAKQVDLRQDNAVDPGDVSMDGEVIQPNQTPDQMPGQPEALDPDQVDEDGNPIESDEDDEQQVDPNQIGEDGEVQGGVPGMPADGTPDLVCPGCGFTSDARPPQTTSLSSEYTDPGDDGTMEGDVCPNCQQAQLMSPQDQKDMQGPVA